MKVRGRTQTLLTAGDVPVSDRQFLGQRGTELCRGVPVFSAYPLSDASHSRQHSRPTLLYARY